MELRCELQRKHIEFLNMMSIDGWRIHVRMDHSVLLNSIYILQPNTQISYFYFLVFFFFCFYCVWNRVCALTFQYLCNPSQEKKLDIKNQNSVILSFAHFIWIGNHLLYFIITITLYTHLLLLDHQIIIVI